MLGGRTNHWGRISLRNGPYDFKPHTRDGLGFDWPMSYEDLAPYYDKVEMLIGVYGANEGLENTPNSLGRRPAAAAEAARQRPARQAARRPSSGIPVVAGPSRGADAAARQRAPSRAAASGQREGAGDPRRRTCSSARACFWATPCGRGCSIRANYQSTTVHLPPALDTGNLDIVTDAMVRAVTKRADGGAEGVVYIDRKTGAEHRVKARVVVLAASALESVRILLNSGVANSSGKVGKYIMDTVGANFSGQVPLLEGLPPHNEDGADGGHMYVPWWLYKAAARREARLRARLSHRVRRRPHHAGHGHRRRPRVAQRRHLRQEAQGRCAALLRFVRRLRRARRDDPERRLLLRARSHREGQVRHSRAALPLEVVASTRLGQAAHMQKTAAEIIEAMGGRYAERAADRREGHQAGRHHHSRSGRRHDGRRPHEVRDEQLRPELGREEPVHHRRRDACVPTPTRTRR